MRNIVAHPNLTSRPVSRLVCTIIAASFAAAFSPLARSAPAPRWTAISAAELAESAPKIEADAPAEILFWRIEVDDKRFPDDRRTTEYIRYKLYAPDRADDIMRISRTSLRVDGHNVETVEIRARLTQPDGTSRELGKESILERPLVRNRAQSWSDRSFGVRVELKEKYLAISGAQPGAIVDVWLSTKDDYVTAATRQVLQREATPIRKLEYVIKAGDSDRYNHRVFVLNTQRAQLTEDSKNHTFTIVATDLPSLADEPFSGSTSDYALTAVSSYIPYSMGMVTDGGGNDSRRIDNKAGPWAVIASVARWVEEDAAAPTGKVKKAAAQLSQGAATDLEKAQRIHNHVRATYQEYQKRSKPRRDYSAGNPSLDAALELGKHLHPNLQLKDFFYLAVSLYRSAGLQAEVLLLPDRTFARLDPKLASQAFLVGQCIAIKVGEQWHFSMPTSDAPLPFGVLPWKYQGQGGLLARANRQDFIDVPLTPPEQSVQTNLGAFQIDATGALTGEFRRSLTGQHAITLRPQLVGKDADHQHVTLKELMAADFKGAELAVTRIANVDDADQPLEVTYSITWPGFAVVTNDRLIVRPSVFRAQAASPFTATSRRNRLVLPFRWLEIDRVMLRVPEGYQPESMAAPPSYPGNVLAYGVRYSFEAEKRLIHVRREFQSAAITVPTEAYADVKTWYDAIINSDQHELVFIKSTTPSLSARD